MDSSPPLTKQQRNVFALVSYYHDAIGEPVPATFVARRLNMSKQRVGQIFFSLYERGRLKGPGAPAVPKRYP